jgi:hypothetical protein
MKRMRFFEKPHIWVDFNNLDRLGRVRLNCIGTLEDLNNKNIYLTKGLELMLYQDDLQIFSVVDYSEEESIWVSKIN